MVALKVNNVSKVYHLYRRNRDRLKETFHPFRKQYHQDFYAIKNISFQLNKGEALGILGENGSGKSTLLKTIAGVLTPNQGNVEAFGTVASLLELGTGFNPEMTGMENIFFYGLINNIAQKAMEKNVKRILDFAEIGEFIHQPVKTYSSGMFVRLAFSCAISIEPEIFIIDEALAVGDAIFTQKCMRFIRSFTKRGTLLFVSHDIASVQNLCQKAIWLQKGEVAAIGSAREVSEKYLQYTLQMISGNEVSLNTIEKEEAITQEEEHIDEKIDYEAKFELKHNLNDAGGWETGGGKIIDVKLQKFNGERPAIYKGGEKIILLVTARLDTEFKSPIIGFLFKDRLGQELFGENTGIQSTENAQNLGRDQNMIQAEFVFRLPMLLNGQYFVTVTLADGNLTENIQHHWLHDALTITVHSSKVRYGILGLSFEKAALRTLEKEAPIL